MWSNVNLGLVKERSNFWQKCDRKNRKNENRKSRIIDPNEWVGAVAASTADKDAAKLSKNKFLSSGNLLVDVETGSSYLTPL